MAHGTWNVDVHGVLGLKKRKVNRMATEVNHCKCGSYDEWETCDSKGVYMEPSINWNGHYRCMNCNNVEQLVNEKEGE